MTTALIAGVAAVLGSLLTIFLTPRLQHHFWKYQRRAELQLATAKEVNRLATEFLTRKLVPVSPIQPDADATWFTALNIAGGEVEVLFSPEASAALQRLDQLTDAHAPKFDRDEFVAARDELLRLLYSEIIPVVRR